MAINDTAEEMQDWLLGGKVLNVAATDAAADAPLHCAVTLAMRDANHKHTCIWNQIEKEEESRAEKV